MKKTLLSILGLSAVLSLSAQSVQPIVINHIVDKACFDDFKDGSKFVDGDNEYSAIDPGKKSWKESGCKDDAGSEDTATAYKGMYWTESNSTCLNNEFEASKTRNATDGSIDYLITQTEGAYEPFLMVFGAYSNAGVKKEYTIDLSADANVSFDIVNKGTKSIRFQVQLQDVNGSSLVYDKGVIGNEGAFYLYQIGYVQGGEKISNFINNPIPAGETKTFDYDFADAIEGCLDNVVGGQGACAEDFDYSKVKAITFTVVDDANTGVEAGTGPATCKDYCPLAISEYPISIKNFKMGDITLLSISKNEEVASFSVYPNPISESATFSKEVTNVKVINSNGILVDSFDSATTINTANYKAGIYMINTDQGSVKVVVE